MSSSIPDAAGPADVLPPPPRPARFRTFRSVTALILREMTTTYGRSSGGYIWAVLEPIGAIAILSLVFSYAFRSPSLGTNFPLFYATAYLPFMLFTDTSNKVAQSILFSRQFLTYPVVSFVDALLARFLLAIITHVMVFYIVLTGVHVVFGLRSIIDYTLVLETMAAAMVLALGIGTLNCFLFTRFPAWRAVWGIATRPLFIISGVLFLFESVPTEIRPYLWYNPLIHLSGDMRAAFYPTYDAAYASLLYVWLVGATCLAFGLLLLRRHHRGLIER